MRLLWHQNAQEKIGGFYSLTRVMHAFNEKNLTDMLWTMRYEWPSGARFAFNCYRHWATLMIRTGNRKGKLLHRNEVVNQSDTLAMIEYGLRILPLIREPRTAHPSVTQPWYADEAGASNTFAGICQHLDDLMV